MTEAFVASPLAQAIGFALLQFLWQGAAIWAVTALLLLTLRRASPRLRHAVACLGLAAMVLATVTTTAGYLRAPVAPGLGSGLAPLTGLNLPASGASLSPAPVTNLSPSVFSREWLAPRLPFVMLVWAAGVLILTTHLFRGWWLVRRLRRTAIPITEQQVIALVHRIGDRIGVTRSLRLLESAFVEVPAVIGWLRPAIVMPATVLTGLPAAHLEAILAHELAHVRRADYLINFIQCVVEILLFYHPAVWWVSRQIRIEREHCCDDVAASLSDRLEYARALASLEELRHVPALAMGARGGELLGRIRRLVDPGVSTVPVASGWLMMTLSLTVLGVAIAGAAALNQQVRDPIVRPAPQASGGGITGIVVDPQGGVIPGATVRIARADLPDQQGLVTTTNAKGEFAFTDFMAGAYELTVSIQAFKTTKMKVQLGPGINLNGTVRLQMGSLSETLTVAGELSPSAAPQPTIQAPSNPVTPADYFDVAKMHYLERRYAEAQAATERALELLRNAGTQQNQFEARVRMDPTGPVRVGGSVKEPKKIKDVKPVYPADALAAGVQGIVIVEAVIDREGFVRDASVLRSIAMLDQAALEAVRQWQFTPTYLNGVPVDVLMTVTVNFSGR